MPKKEYFSHKLSNGAKIVLSPRSETEAVTVLILFRVGSRYETRNIAGISHFLEHMMFKGTTKRPTPQIIARELDSLGAEYNAFTDKDNTGYYIKCAKKHINKAVDILADMIHNPLFQEAEFERERGVILEEINMYEDNPLMYIHHVFDEAVYGDAPMGWDIAGTKKTVGQMKLSSLAKYFNDHYNPNNLVVAVSGNFDKLKILGMLKKNFGQKKSLKKNNKNFKLAKISKSKSVVLQNRNIEQANLVMGFPGFSYYDKDLYKLTLLSTILGGGMSSRLFTQIREKRGLCYSISSYLGLYEDSGFFAIAAGLAKSRLKEAIKAIWQEIELLKTEKVDSKELKKAKDYLIGRTVLALEDSESIASFYGKQMLFDRKIETPGQKIKKIKSVSALDIQKIANKVIDKKAVKMALIGPYKNKSKFINLLNKLS